MANSLIEDVINEEPSNGNGNNNNNFGGNFNNQKPPKKKGKKKFIILFLILIILIVAALFAIQYLQNPTTVVASNKAKFFELLMGNNVEDVASADIYADLGEKLTSENSNISTEISIDYETEDYSINNILLTIDSQNDVENSKSYSNLNLNYSNNDLFNIELLADSEKFGLKSDDVVDTYVGCDYTYLLENYESLIEEMNTEKDTQDDETTDESEDYFEDEEDYFEYSYDEDYEDSYSTLSMYASLLEGMDYEEIAENLSSIGNLEISEASIQIYKDLIDENLDESLFTSQEVTLETDNGNIDSTEYTLTLPVSDFMNLLKEMLTALETDTETLDTISAIFQAFDIDDSLISYTIESLISSIDEAEVEDENIIISSIDEAEVEDGNIIIKVYEADGETIKVSLEYADVLIEVEYGYGDSNNYIKVTILDSSTNTGFTFKVTNENLDLSKQFDLEISIIEDSYEIGKFTMNSSVTKSGNTYSADVAISYKDSEENSITVDVEVDITFEDVEVPDLEDEGYYALDEVSDEERQSTLNSLSEQISTVVINKISELSFIDTNTTTTVIEQSSSENEEDDESAKEEAMNTLIEAISNEMGEAEANGEEYTLENLEDLAIEDHEVSVSISNDIAEVSIDGYTFNLDSDFNLSE